MDMILILNDCSVKCYGNVKSKEGSILFQKSIAKSIKQNNLSLFLCNFNDRLIYDHWLCVCCMRPVNTID